LNRRRSIRGQSEQRGGGSAWRGPVAHAENNPSSLVMEKVTGPAAGTLSDPVKTALKL
jgi:hypothetical protein